jgi:hypothetical protein
MNIDLVVQQLRALAPIFNGNIAGAAAYANGVNDQVWLPLPAAYVVPGGEDAGDNQVQTGLLQIVTERISVIIVIQTLSAGGALDLADRRAQAAAAAIDTYRGQIFHALLNWRPDWNPATPFDGNTESRGFYFMGAGYPEGSAGFDRARFFYEYRFGLDMTISDADGWPLPYVPLTRVDGPVVSQIDQAETLGVFDLPLQGSP